MPSKNVITILIADPHAVTRAGIAAALTAKGPAPVFYEVATAHDAITATAKHRPQVAIIEVNLPDMNGLIAAHQMLKEKNTATRVVVLTDVTQDREMERAYSIGVHGWVDKNSHVKKLGEAVEKICAGQTWFDEAFTKHLKIHADVPGYGKLDLNSKLTQREIGILCLIANERNDQQIADLLNITHRTATKHREHIKEKLGIRTAVGLSNWCKEAGLVRTKF